MDNCSQHKKSVLGEENMEVVAEAIGNLNYESAIELYMYLQEKYERDSLRDRNHPTEPKPKLANVLHLMADEYNVMAALANSAWQISKPFMESKHK